MGLPLAEQHRNRDHRMLHGTRDSRVQKEYRFKRLSVVQISVVNYSVSYRIVVYVHLLYLYRYNKRRGAPRDGEGQCAGCDRL